ncbi:MAG: ABC transporter ATP-binding protein [Minisyncoccia bacterium]
MLKGKKRNPLVYLFRRTWEFSGGNRKNVVLYLLMSVMSELVETFWSPLVVSRIINLIQSKGITAESFRDLIFYLALFPIGDLIFWSLHGPSRVKEECNAFLARANLRRFQLKGVMGLPLEWHSEHHSGDTIDRLEKGANSMYEFSSETFRFVKPIVKLLGCAGAIIYFSNESVFIVLGAIGLSAWITVLIDGKCIGPQIRELSQSENRISESVHDAINNISSVIVLRVERFVFNSIMQRIMSPFDLFRKNTIQNEIKWFLTSLCCSLMMVLVLGTYFWDHYKSGEAIVISSLYLLVSYLTQISSLFYEFTGLYGWTTRRMFRLLNSEELSEDFVSESMVNHVLPTNWKTISVENLCFSYGVDRTEPHLDDVSFLIQRGEKVAVISRTGGGKTTLLKVMRDLYHPHKCRLYVDGELVDSGFEGISQDISMIQQNPEIFETTILGNITLSADYDPEIVRHYMDMACFTEVADALPKGLMSMIQEKGVNLSGGQVQRLALSRGLLASHNKGIILLDEPTSSLDPATAGTVFRNILEGFRDKTVISTLHSLQFLPLFDRVIVLEDGRIVGSGTIQELSRGCIVFQELWQRQFSEAS